MASLESSSKDIAYSNLMQTTLMRTTSGFVPNFASGFHASVDRTEPQLGAFVALQIYNKWKEAWVIEVIIDALYSWNTWVFTYRRGEGVLAGSDGRADLIVLGSDPNHSPRGVVGGEDNLQAARYESGLDNSPMYVCEDQRAPRRAPHASPLPLRTCRLTGQRMGVRAGGVAAARVAGPGLRAPCPRPYNLTSLTHALSTFFFIGMMAATSVVRAAPCATTPPRTTWSCMTWA